jgi:hypothetical protein
VDKRGKQWIEEAKSCEPHANSVNNQRSRKVGYDDSVTALGDFQRFDELQEVIA